jgi:hypothetical protein
VSEAITEVRSQADDDATKMIQTRVGAPCVALRCT